MAKTISHGEVVDLKHARAVLEKIVESQKGEELQIGRNHKVKVLDSESEGIKMPRELVPLVKDSFQVVYSYLKDVSDKKQTDKSRKQAIEELKQMMMLIKEAAGKIDRYHPSYQNYQNRSIKNCREYKQLKGAYDQLLTKKGKDTFLGKWIQPIKTEASPQSIKKLKERAYIDLESIKRDTQYELFFIRKGNGRRYFNIQIIKSIKSTLNLGSPFSGRSKDDTLNDIHVWRDRITQMAAMSVLASLGSNLDRFYEETRRYRKWDLVSSLSKSLMALMLSANEKNLINNSPAKPSYLYFADFQFFLRKALESKEYRKLLMYPPKKSSSVTQTLLDLTHQMCEALFLNLIGHKKMINIIQTLIDEESDVWISGKFSKEPKEFLWKRLCHDYATIAHVMERLPNGPLFKVLEAAEKKLPLGFDPFIQQNLSNRLYEIYLNEKKIIHFRMPTPTQQEQINKVHVTQEFMGFLRSYRRGRGHKKHLLINLQDKTSWREYERCQALENLQSDHEIAECLEVVTLAKDSDFYLQKDVYHDMDDAKIFLDQFMEHMMSPSSGYSFPEGIKAKLFPKWMENALSEVHTAFFEGKSSLSRSERLDFVEIFYLFLQLKLIEVSGCESFSFTCKDGVDTGASSSALFFMFLKMINHRKFSENERKYMNEILYGPALLLRERTILQDRFERMASALHCMEEVVKGQGPTKFKSGVQKLCKRLFKAKVCCAKAMIPRFGGVG